MIAMQCGHSFCKSCLDQMKNLNNYICPLCREVIVNEKPNYELIELNKNNHAITEELQLNRTCRSNCSCNSTRRD